MTSIKNQDRIGLAVMEAQTLHVGHVKLLTYMISTVPTVVIGLGSVKKFNTEGHPFDFNQRVEMIETIFGVKTFKFIPLDDIDSSIDNDEWSGYVMKKVSSIGLQKPTDYFSGSRIDAKWYESHFARTLPDTRTTMDGSASAMVFTDGKSGARTHIVDREKSDALSGRDIRFLIERRDSEWKKYVPERLHHFIEWNYPPHLREAIREPFPDLSPDAPQWPVGTRLMTDGENNRPTILELKDDGKWRPLPTRDEKAEYARNRRKLKEN